MPLFPFKVWLREQLLMLFVLAPDFLNGLPMLLRTHKNPRPTVPHAGPSTSAKRKVGRWAEVKKDEEAKWEYGTKSKSHLSLTVMDLKVRHTSW